MPKSFLTFAVIAIPMTMAIGMTPASAGPFCATYSDGGSFRSCSYPTYASCLRTVRGAGGMCVVNRFFTGDEGYGAYAYAPGPAYRAPYEAQGRYYGPRGMAPYMSDDIE